jgi:hypothetical protein
MGPAIRDYHLGFDERAVELLVRARIEKTKRSPGSNSAQCAN